MPTKKTGTNGGQSGNQGKESNTKKSGPATADDKQKGTASKGGKGSEGKK